jgi:glycosyltransferase involved in cell wall biosynthesis
MTPYFSVLIPAYNAEDMIAATLMSLEQQRFKDFETIVIDDGSVDATVDVVAKFASVQLLTQANAGQAAARNAGLSVAQGRYIVFLDSDDLFFPWTLEVLHQVLEQTPAAILMSRAHRFSDPAQLNDVVQSPLTIRSFPTYLNSAPARLPVSICGVVQTDAMRAYGGFTAELRCSEEQDLYLRMGLEGGFVFVESPPLYAYRQRAYSVSRTMQVVAESVRQVIDRERSKVYPGGDTLRLNRAIVYARMVRYTISRCLQCGDRKNAVSLYRYGFRYLWQTGYYRDLISLPGKILRLP